MDFNKCFSAAYQNEPEVLRKAIEELGVSPNLAHEEGGHTLLQSACQEDSISSIAVLLELGADPNLTFTIKDAFSDRAIAKNATAIFFIESVEAAELLIGAGADINHIDDFGFSPLYKAAKMRRLNVVDLLCSNGANYKEPLIVKGKKVSVIQLIENEIKELKNILPKTLTDKQIKLFKDYDEVLNRLRK